MKTIKLLFCLAAFSCGNLGAMQQVEPIELKMPEQGSIIVNRVQDLHIKNDYQKPIFTRFFYDPEKSEISLVLVPGAVLTLKNLELVHNLRFYAYGRVNERTNLLKCSDCMTGARSVREVASNKQTC